ncbi:MAG: hypothetical protein PVJ72_05955 [Gammaproteobacteria bacterium]|jgi:hypothetical protein
MSQLRIGEVITVAGVTLIPVEKIDIYSRVDSSTRWWYGSKELFAIVVNTSSGLQVFDNNAKPMNISELISYVPKLEETIHRTVAK